MRHKAGGHVAGQLARARALHAAGKARAIGVSNFDAGELRELARVATVQPAVVQRNSDVFAADLGVRIFCTARGWQYEAYSSLGTQWLMKGTGPTRC